jgi:hypothetical protein
VKSEFKNAFSSVAICAYCIVLSTDTRNGNGRIIVLINLNRGGFLVWTGSTEAGALLAAKHKKNFA